MLDVQLLLLDCTVRVINQRTRLIVEEHRDLSEVEAYRIARQLAEGLADDYMDDDAHAKREFPFVPDILSSIDPFRVEVLQRDADGILGWRGERNIIDGYVMALGRCAY